MDEQTKLEIDASFWRSRKTAGDELDRLALEMQARDNCSYALAFKRVCILRPDLVKAYQGED